MNDVARIKPFKPILITVVGPTAVGKTSLCITLAEKLHIPILSADSRQFFREMEIGTAKPTHEERLKVTHYFVDHKSIHDAYDVNLFEKEVLNFMDTYFKQKKVLLLTGGSGLYVDAITKGFDPIPPIAPHFRERAQQLFQSEGLAALQREIRQLDPAYAAEVDMQNPQRLMRALEVCWGTGVPYSGFRQKQLPERPFRTIKIGLERPREELYARIDQRMDLMLEAGLLREVEALYPYRELNALQTVGYTELFAYLEGQYDYDEAVRLLKRNSRRYAKRQLTWFRRDPEIHWFHPDAIEDILRFIDKKIAAPE
ncbi:tRNA delta(2)-isopentenylpyrophosphate transferase [Nitritalea halalkaliphila LW7]|uniref:tRNA dimethylallyltransferase n=1 Tax=Nitritalea halalkaliphila LW7 TaxID=1189621 RepID=I5C2X2_9BACT|nr:tRNA (adenosine(37)-N6)-dimethylallyltransferase MiaA [Nitritalea halalkaliphila]EIM76174.1 tRNA delta(2)-isopentenylpyrophosphate transferase [Nitritalea halalkaliphila LW7]